MATPSQSADRRTGIVRLARLVAAALVLFVVFNIAGAFVADAVLGRSGMRFSTAAHGGASADVLVVGNSRAVNLVTGRRDADPSFFNIGYNGIGRDAALALVEAYFRAGNRAGTVLIEVTALFDDGANCDLKPYWGLIPELASAAASGCASDVVTGRYLPLTRYNSELFLRALYYLVIRPGGDQDWANGYDLSPESCAALPTSGITAAAEQIRLADLAPIRASIDRPQADLQRVPDTPRVRFVLAPYFADAATLTPIATISGVVSRAVPNQDLLDLSRALGAECTDFADAVHTSAAGRAVLLPRLIAFVAAP